ncbi:MAG: hypothetical protein QOI57_237 [Rubrobacteraceae bacterium]|nr:hypothetical protein [Rubrobacteraceae bacterium]
MIKPRCKVLKPKLLSQVVRGGTGGLRKDVLHRPRGAVPHPRYHVRAGVQRDRDVGMLQELLDMIGRRCRKTTVWRR